MGLFSLTQELAIDLGTANTIIINNGKIVVDEPSIVALDQHSGKLVAIGKQARQMHGKTHQNIRTIRPLKDGVIADFNAAELMLRGLIKMVKSSGRLFSPSLKMVISIPSGSTNVEIRAVRDSAEHAGGREVYMIYEPMAAALGAGLDVEAPEGHMVVDIGGGTTDVTVFYKNSVRHVGIVPMGGNAINRDIRSYGILERHVESLKVRYGSAMRDQIKTEMSIKTPGLNARMPKEISLLNLAAIIEARMLDIIDFVMAEIKASGCQQKLGAGVVLTGGAAQMKDLDLLFKNYTGIDVRVATPDTVIEPGSIESASNPALATAVGLLLKGLSSGRPVRGSRPQTRPARQEAQPELGGNSYGAASTENPQRRTINTLYRERKAAADREQEFIDEETQEEPVTGKTKKGGGLFGRLKQKIDNMFDVIEDNEI